MCDVGWRFRRNNFFVNCIKKSITDDERDWALKVLTPYFLSLVFASLFESPLSLLETYLKISVVVRLQNFSVELFMVEGCIFYKLLCGDLIKLTDV